MKIFALDDVPEDSHWLGRSTSAAPSPSAATTTGASASSITTTEASAATITTTASRHVDGIRDDEKSKYLVRKRMNRANL